MYLISSSAAHHFFIIMFSSIISHRHLLKFCVCVCFIFVYRSARGACVYTALSLSLVYVLSHFKHILTHTCRHHFKFTLFRPFVRHLFFFGYFPMIPVVSSAIIHKCPSFFSDSEIRASVEICRTARSKIKFEEKFQSNKSTNKA